MLRSARLGPRRALRWLVPLALALGVTLPATVLAGAPTADAKPSESTLEDTLTTITLSGTDPDGDILSFVVATEPGHGSLSNFGTVNCDSQTPSSCTETVDYTPAADFNGSDSFTYHVNDGVSDSGDATVSIDVTPVNDPPTAADKTPTTNEDTLVSVTMSGADVDGDPLTFAIANQPSHGTLSNFGSRSCDGQTPSSCTETVDYTPDANYHGSDSFTYTTNDLTVDSSSATVTLTVNSVNDAPTAANKPTESTNEDALVTITLSGGDVDGGGLTFAVVAQPTHGTLGNPGSPSCDGLTPSSCTQTIDYTPSANYNGPDSFTYRTNDGTANSTAATVSIGVTAVNDAPSFTKGANQSVLRDQGAQSVATWATNLIAGPSDESGQALHFNVTGDTNPGLFAAGPAIDSTGALTYTPQGTAIGTATITATLSDDGGILNGGADTSASQQFTITILGLVAHNDLPTVTEGGAQAVAVLANDTPASTIQVAVTIQSVTQGAHGAVTITGGGTGLTYDPAAGYLGNDSFTYTIKDTPGTLTSTATVSIKVVTDTTPPTVTSIGQSLRTGVSMTTAIPIRIAWGATDAGVGVKSYTFQRSIDGGTYATITLPSALTASYSSSVSVGHTYRYRVRATDKNGNVSAYRYTVAFKGAIYQDTSGPTYSGVWGTASSTSYSGGTTHYTGTAGRSVQLTTSGRDFAFVGPISSTRGTASIYVDNVLIGTTLNEHSATTFYKRVIWATHFSSLGTHTIRFVVTGPARIDIDCFLVLR